MELVDSIQFPSSANQIEEVAQLTAGLGDALNTTSADIVALAVHACGLIVHKIFDEIEADTTGHWFGKKWDDQDPVVENLLVTLEDFFKDLKAWISSSFFYAKVVRQALDRVKRSKLLKDLMVATKRLVPASSSSQGTMSQGGKATTTKQTKPKKATFFKKPKDKADDKAQPITMTTDAAATSDFEVKTTSLDAFLSH
ncbi:hypothetical protein DYB38_012936 [Aphanomyces astaci]|uniref:Uncharacterized protein n=1 Tax=Aphanomyces astaci TaxID=112090 RepID=A0A397DYZ4_APHAT|nr:hypothetical protein DYB38_012936 [Aphanomyces astaci]